ncbi:hypothetical protein [Neisseria weixii]|uniref:hypothetical protein n=1 Tax=Neisseria weixii TaxID=1853276 RepID=UPI00359FD6D5
MKVMFKRKSVLNSEKSTKGRLKAVIGQNVVQSQIKMPLPTLVGSGGEKRAGSKGAGSWIRH